MIHYKNTSGREKWIAYDDKNRVIYTKNEKGYETWIEYCDNGEKIVKTCTAKGFKTTRKYNVNDDELYYKDDRGKERTITYHGNNIIHYYTDSTGVEKEYNTEGSLIYIKHKDRECIWFDNNKQILHMITWGGLEFWNEYDTSGYCVNYKDSRDINITYNPDDKISCILNDIGTVMWLNHRKQTIHAISDTGVETWIDYDDNGNLLHYRNCKGYPKILTK